MIRAPFQLHRPHSIDAAVRLLSQCVQNGEDAKLLAGGQSLLPSLNLGLIAPAHIISLNHVAGLDAIRRDGDMLAIGAGTTHHALAESEVVQATVRFSARPQPVLVMSRFATGGRWAARLAISIPRLTIRPYSSCLMQPVRLSAHMESEPLPPTTSLLII